MPNPAQDQDRFANKKKGSFNNVEPIVPRHLEHFLQRHKFGDGSQGKAHSHAEMSHLNLLDN